MFLYSAVRNWYLNPFRTGLPFWAQITWNQIEIYVSVQCTTKLVLNPLRTGLPFWEQITWNQSEIHVQVQCSTKMVLHPFRTGLPFWEQITWNQSEIHVSVQCSTKMVLNPLRTGLPFWEQITWNQSEIHVQVQCSTKMVLNPFRTGLPFWEQISWNQSETHFMYSAVLKGRLLAQDRSPVQGTTHLELEQIRRQERECVSKPVKIAVWTHPFFYNPAGRAKSYAAGAEGVIIILFPQFLSHSQAETWKKNGKKKKRPTPLPKVGMSER